MVYRKSTRLFFLIKQQVEAKAINFLLEQDKKLRQKASQKIEKVIKEYEDIDKTQELRKCS